MRRIAAAAVLPSWLPMWPAFGIPAGVVTLGVLALLFSPAGVRWAAGGDQRGPASSANREPDNR